jgi:hypothetical protein
MAATGNSETFEYELGYAWLDIWALERLFYLVTWMQKQKPYSDSPQNFTTFEYKVDLHLNRASGPTLGTNPNVVPC